MKRCLKLICVMAMTAAIMPVSFAEGPDPSQEKRPATVELKLSEIQGRRFFFFNRRAVMPYFPFEYEYLGERHHEGVHKGVTDAYGRALISVDDCQSTTRVAIYVPSKMEDLYRVKEVDAAYPDPRTDTSDENLYNNGFFDNEIGWHYIPPVLGLKEGSPTPRWKDLTTAQQDKIRSAFQGRIDALRANGKALLAREEHPNCRIAEFKPGDTRLVKMNYRPTRNELSVRLKFVDQITQKPLGNVTGFVSELNLGASIGNMTLGVGDLAQRPEKLRSCVTPKSGEATVSHIMLSENMMNGEAGYLKAGEAADPYLEPHLYIAARTPGYVYKMFQLPLSMARSGKTLVCEMEPEAIVRGRIVLPGGRTLTNEGLKGYFSEIGLLQEVNGLLKDLKVNGGAPVEPTIQGTALFLTNRKQNERGRYDPTYYHEYAETRSLTNGRFEMQGIRPCKGWSLEINISTNPAMKMTRAVNGIELKPGMNDLGDITIGAPGTLSGRIMDGQGKSLEKVEVELVKHGYDDFARAQTDANGKYKFDLQEITREKAWVRLTPPWAIQPDEGYYGFAGYKNIRFERIHDIDLNGSNTLSTRLDQGNTLIVELMPGKARDELFQFYSDPKHSTVEPDRKKEGAVELAVGGAALQGLKPNPEGFVYMQRMMRPEASKPGSDGKIRLRLENVPAGRHALRVDGYYYYIKRRPEDSSHYKQIQNAGENFAPLAYTEFEMAPTTTTIQVNVNAAVVEFEVDGVPDGIANPYFLPCILFDRMGPLSTWHGQDTYRTLVEQYQIHDEPEEYLLPMVGYYGGFAEFADNRKFLGYRPWRLPCIPAGKYRMRMFSGDIVKSMARGVPIYEETVEAPQGGGIVHVHVPFAKRRKPDVPRPKYE